MKKQLYIPEEKSYEHLLGMLYQNLEELKDTNISTLQRDAQLARSDRWLHKIANKVGVKLEA